MCSILIRFICMCDLGASHNRPESNRTCHCMQILDVFNRNNTTVLSKTLSTSLAGAVQG